MRPGVLMSLTFTIAVMAGCGGETAARMDVRDYMKQVNRLEEAVNGEVKKGNKAYLSFAQGKLEPEDALDDLRRIDIRLRQVDDDLKALDAPPAAEELHGRYLKLYEGILDFTQQTAVLANYQAGADDALEPVVRINRDLRRGLKRAKTPRGQALQLDRFANGLRLVLNDLRNLDAPRVLRTSHGDQVRRLARSRKLALRLRRAVVRGQSERVSRLLDQFAAAAAGRPRRALARRAIVAYGQRSKALNRAYTDVIHEFNRLDHDLR